MNRDGVCVCVCVCVCVFVIVCVVHENCGNHGHIASVHINVTCSPDRIGVSITYPRVPNTD
jgi:hypothetical protein